MGCVQVSLRISHRRLIDGLNVDTGAREALGEIPEGKQVQRAKNTPAQDW